MDNSFEPLKQLSDLKPERIIYAIAMRPDMYDQIRSQVKEGYYTANQEAGFTPMVTGVSVYKWNRMDDPVRIYYSYDEMMQDYPDNH